MDAATDLRRMVVGHRLSEPLLVLDVEHRESARGGFTLLTLGNRHGRLPTAPFWPADHARVAGVERGAVAQVTGEIGQYQGIRQIKVTSIHMLPAGTVDNLLKPENMTHPRQLPEFQLQPPP